MTVNIWIGRRIPRNWAKRQLHRLGGLISFQENLWMMLKQSFSTAKRKATEANTLSFVMEKDFEHEDLMYDLEWIKIKIQGTKEQEQEEYDEAMKMYEPYGRVFKELNFNSIKEEEKSKMKVHFKSKILNSTKVEDAYKQGYGAISENNIAAKLLECGILTSIEKVNDVDGRI